MSDNTMLVFQASDLSQRGRAILDAARKGEARLRDRDGMSLLVIPEGRFRAAMAILSATANLMAIEQMQEINSPNRSLRDYGDWTWLREFDDEDLDEFVHEMRAALLIASREESDAQVAEALDRWHSTADQLHDPVRRAILLNTESLTEADFVEAAPPG